MMKKRYRIIIKVDVQLPEKLYELHNDLLYLPEKIKIEKLKNLWQIYTVKKNVIHIRNLRQALNYKLVSKKVHRIIKFNQKAWLKSYIDMSANLRKNAKNDFEKDFFKLKNNAVFVKTMGNMKNPRDINLQQLNKEGII